MNSELQNCQQTEPCTVEEIRNSLEQSEKGKVYNTAANYKRVLQLSLIHISESRKESASLPFSPVGEIKKKRRNSCEINKAQWTSWKEWRLSLIHI